MVGEPRQLELTEVLTEKQIHHVLKQSIGDDVPWQLTGSEVRPAVDGIAGFLGDHMKAVLRVQVAGEEKKVHLFIKRLPVFNRPKADFIDEHHYFRREKLMFNVLENIREYGPNPWCVKAFIYTDTLMVMPDITFAGFSCRHFLDTLDSEHIFVTTTSLASFHAAFVNYETKKSIELRRPYSILQEYEQILSEPTFCESPYLKSCSKLSINILKNYSAKSYHNLPEIDTKLNKMYLKACNSLTEYKDTVNALIHKDLWVNNIMFKYKNEVPVLAVLIDYQCLRYAPPAFDLMIFLYLTTDRRYREERERDIFNHYYSVFVKNLSDESKKRIEGFGYDKDNFLHWCEEGRMFGIVEAIAITPFTLMDPKTAQKSFDDPETYEKCILEDRSEPVLAYANRCEPYKLRNLEVTEEFIERSGSSCEKATIPYGCWSHRQNSKINAMIKHKAEAKLSLVWDATCVDTLAPSHLPSTAIGAGAAAAAAENLKWRKYSSLVGNYMFEPYGVETLGSWSPSARMLFKEITKRLFKASGIPKAGLFRLTAVWRISMMPKGRV